MSLKTYKPLGLTGVGKTLKTAATTTALAEKKLTTPRNVDVWKNSTELTKQHGAPTVLPSLSLDVSEPVTVDFLKASGLQPTATMLREVDLARTLGSPDSVASAFTLSLEAGVRAQKAVEQAPLILARMSSLTQTSKAITAQDTAAASSQHAAYMTFRLDERLGGRLNGLIANQLLEEHFSGKLGNKKKPNDALRVLLKELKATAVGRKDHAAFNEWFTQNSRNGRLEINYANAAGARNNWGSVLAGRATIEFAQHLVGDLSDTAAARSLLRETFARSPESLSMLIKSGRGLPGLLARFASLANHDAWRVNELAAALQMPVAEATAHLDALKPAADLQMAQSSNASDAGALAAMVFASLGSVRLNIDPAAQTALKSDLRTNLAHVAANGAHDVDGNLTPEAASAGIAHALIPALELGNIPVLGRVADSVLLEALTSFFPVEQGGSRERARAYFGDVLRRFAPDLDRLHADRAFTKDDEHYRELYQQLSGTHSYNALREAIGDATAATVAQNTHVADLIPLAARAVKTTVGANYTAETVARDIETLKQTLLKKDYFLQAEEGQSESATLARLKAEATVPLNKALTPAHVEMEIRGPNVAWMKLVTIRAVVENRADRLEAAAPDMTSDTFPDSVQYNAPEVRDAHLFAWARHRLTVAGVPAQRANELALSLVVFTQYKDLLQIRKAAGVT